MEKDHKKQIRDLESSLISRQRDLVEKKDREIENLEGELKRCQDRIIS